MIRAYPGEQSKRPIVGDIAENANEIIATKGYQDPWDWSTDIAFK